MFSAVALSNFRDFNNVHFQNGTILSFETEGSVTSHSQISSSLTDFHTFPQNHREVEVGRDPLGGHLVQAPVQAGPPRVSFPGPQFLNIPRM